MFQYIIKRLLGLIPTLLIVGALVFMFVHLLPGDPARLAAGPDATPETVDLVRKDLGLDASLPTQFLRFAAGNAPGRLRAIGAHQATGLDRNPRAILCRRSG